jgi:hypothetical protein
MGWGHPQNLLAFGLAEGLRKFCGKSIGPYSITANSQAQRTDWFRIAAAVTPSRRIISKRARGRFRSSLLTVANRNKPANHG